MYKRLTLLCTLAFLFACSAWAQGYGSVSGTITDPSGAVIPGANVKATEVSTNTTTTSTTSAEGRYQILQLRPGTYAIEVDAAGFKTFTRKDVKVDVAARITLDLAMEVGGASESVSVTGEVPLLRTEDAQTGEVINDTMIKNLPMLDRNPLTLARLSGLVAGSGVSGNGDYDDFHIAGGRTGSVDYAVDGQNISTGRGHNIMGNAVPTMESVGEFKVITNGLSAEYGRSSGGIVEVVTRGGTNELHGQGFEYFRNELLNANSWMQNATGGQRQIYKQNVYGGDIGGPVVLPKLYNGRNKTFWYFNFQGTKYREAATNQLAGVPTVEERNGDMTHTLYNGRSPMMYDPLGEIVGSGYGSAFFTTPLGGDGMHVPATRVSDFAKAVIALTPLPNRAPTPGFTQENNYVGQSAYKSDAVTWTTRIDEYLTERQRLSLRFKRDNSSNGTSSWLGALNPPVTNRGNQQLTANLTYDFTISPTVVLSARAGATVMPSVGGPQWASDFNPADFPYDPSVKAWATQDRIPFSVIIDTNGAGWGNQKIVNNQMPHSDALSYNNFNYGATVTKIWNKHLLKMGGEARRYYDNFLESGLGWMRSNGYATMRNAFGGEWVETDQNKVAANAWGDFMLGYLNQASQSAPWTMALGFSYYAGFVQDDFKVTPNLTLNLGLRWDTETPVTERNNKLVAWDPDSPSFFTIPSDWNWNNALRTAGLTDAQIARFPEPQWSKDKQFPNGRMAVAGTPEYPGRTLQPFHGNHWAPRLGAAYRINNKTTVRASGTVMYISATGGYYSMWSTVVPSTSANAPYDGRDAEGRPNVTYNNMFTPENYSYYKHTLQEANYQVGGNLGGPVYSMNVDMPREYQWNFTLQRQVTKTMVAEAQYAGNHSGNLLVVDSMNPFPKQYLDPQLASLLATKIQNPVYGQIMADDNNYTGQLNPLGLMLTSNPSRGYLNVQGTNQGSSMYNALNLRLERRMADGVAFLVNYTYSKSLDDVGGPNESFWGSGSFNKSHQPTDTFRNVYGYSPIDRTHRVVWYHDVQLPLGQGRRFLGHPQTFGARTLDKVIGGWEVAGNAMWQSGTPITFWSANGVSSKDQGADGLTGFVLGAPDQIKAAGFSNPNSMLRSPNDARTECGGAFNCQYFQTPTQQLVYGNMGSVYPWIRNPGYFNYDASLMKSFNFTEHSYLQLRLEAENVFNIRGLGGWNTTYNDPTFGYITGAGNNPRRMQISGRIYF